MKRIFFYIILFFTGLFIFSTDLRAVNTVTVKDVIFKEEEVQNPYCSTPGECNLEKGINDAKGKVEGIKKDGTAVGYIQEVVSYVIGFLFVITVLLIIWAGFMILTAAGNDDKIDNAKKIIKNSVIGLIVIFLSYAITSFIVNTLSSSKSTVKVENKN